MDAELKRFLADAAARLRRATVDRRAPWRTPSVATVAPDGAPELRHMVLRDFDSDHWRFALHTDARSRKCTALAAEPRIALTFWDPKARLQLRIAGAAQVSPDPTAWRALSIEARKAYAATQPPGSAIIAPHDYAFATADDGAQFRQIRVEAYAIDLLELDPNGHRRAHFELAPSKDATGAWVCP